MSSTSHEDLQREIDDLRSRLGEANDIIDAIRTGQIDALVVNGDGGHSLYTLRSADVAYRFFVEQMAEGAVSLNSEGLIIYSNSQFARMINRPPSDIVGKAFVDMVAVAHRAKFNDLFSESGKGNIKAEIVMESGSGEVSVQLSFNVLQIEGENTRGVIVTDLTLQKEIEKELKQKNDELERLNDALLTSNHDLLQFASVASHDLQEPLRKIQVFSKFLKDRSYDELSDASKQYVEKIISCAHRMKTLIVDILTYSRLSAGDPNLELVDLNQLLTEIVDDFDLRVSEKNARIDVQGTCNLEGNQGQLRQVFYNLISNALKFAAIDRPLSLVIQLSRLDPRDLGLFLADDIDYCRITVTDNGIGFDDKYASSIFSLFETLNPKTIYEGSGIGLAIAKRIVDKHHGFIVAKSVKGQGSEFNVILPFKQPDSI